MQAFRSASELIELALHFLDIAVGILPLRPRVYRLKAFIDPKRKAIFQRDGEPRAYRFRFRQPAMQPFVLMKGITEGLIDADATRALSSPEQPDFFAT